MIPNYFKPTKSPQPLDPATSSSMDQDKPEAAGLAEDQHPPYFPVLLADNDFKSAGQADVDDNMTNQPNTGTNVQQKISDSATNADLARTARNAHGQATVSAPLTPRISVGNVVDTFAANFDAAGMLPPEGEEPDDGLAGAISSVHDAMNAPTSLDTAQTATSIVPGPGSVNDGQDHETDTRPPIHSSFADTVIAELQCTETPFCHCKPLLQMPKSSARPKSEPPLDERAIYRLKANWPPPPPPPNCDFRTNIKIFPPKDAPLQIHLQAYALRWSVWVTEVKDEERRKELCEAVATKMKEAWETVVKEEIYPRPAFISDTDQHESEEKKKRRKKLQDPAQLPIPFVCEGKDPFPITFGELAQRGITWDMIDRRLHSRGAEDADVLLDEVLEELDRDKLVIRDWSPHPRGSIICRNLTMYCLWVVQESREQLGKLERLARSFKREIQKRNTNRRIEICNERIAQHLALAAESRARGLERGDPAEVGKEKADEDDPREVDLTSQNSDDEDESAEVSDTDSAVREKIIEVAERIMLAINDSTQIPFDESTLHEAFVISDLSAEDLVVQGGLDVGSDKQLQAAKSALAEIYTSIQHLISFIPKVNRQENPQERLRMILDVKMVRNKIVESKKHLKRILRDNLPSGQTEQEQNAGDEKEDHAMSESRDFQDAQDGSDQLSDGRIFPTVDTVQQGKPLPSGQVTESAQQASQVALPEQTSLQYVPMSASYQQNSVITNALDYRPSLQHTGQMMQDPGAIYKQAYIKQGWQPFLNSELQEQGKALLQHDLAGWPQIKEVLVDLGFGPDSRNVFLQKFKTGFNDFLAKNGVQTRPDTQSSPAPSSGSLSPSLSQKSFNTAAAAYPTEAEILAAIPPQGIPGLELVRRFGSRIGNRGADAANIIRRIARVDTNHMVYPPVGLRAMQPQIAAAPRMTNTTYDGPYDTAPPGQNVPSQTTRRPVPPARGQEATPQSPHQVVKLKLPTPQPIQYLNPSELSLPSPQDERGFPEGLKSVDVNATKGFAFQHLPHATIEQRKAMEDYANEYIAKINKVRSKKKRPYGQYITFTDPQDQDPRKMPIMHGFWDTEHGEHVEGSEWFYSGKEVPDDYLPRLIGAAGNDEPTAYHVAPPPVQAVYGQGDGVSAAGPQLQSQYRDVYDQDAQRNVRIKFKPLQMPGFSQQQNTNQDYDQAHVQQGFNSGYSKGQCDGTTGQVAYHPDINMNTGTRNGRQNAFSYQCTGSTGTDYVNPADLSLVSTPTRGRRGRQAQAATDDYPNTLPETPASKRGTKRAASGGAGARRSKKKPAEDNDEDYDPSQDP